MFERGAATVEWTGLVLLVAVALGGALAVASPAVAPWLPRAIRCALLAGCRGEDARLEQAYGEDVAAYVRAYAPGIAYEPGTLTLPVDFRHCRGHPCSDAPEARGEDVWRSRAGRRATVFTHAVDRRAQGGDLFLQYWLYYPDSTYSGTARAVSRATPRVLAYTPAGLLSRRVAGFHRDDWESYQVRVRPDGSVLARASAHHGYAGRRRWPNLNELPVEPRPRTGAWTAATGWTRVSRGSHAGHVPDGPGARERRTESAGLALVPIETLPPDARAAGFAVVPPWEKPVYGDPTHTGT